MADQQQPLWKVLHETFLSDVGEIDLGDGYDTVSGDPDAGTWAAMIEALANVIVPEEPEPPSSRWHPEVGFYSDRDWQRWHARQQIRKRLLDEARRAREAT